jgi:hypothetical protein
VRKLRGPQWAFDKRANVVVVELKRDQSGSVIECQAIKYASYCSSLTTEELYALLARYRGIDADSARLAIEDFIDEELDRPNGTQGSSFSLGSSTLMLPIRFCGSATTKSM